MAATEAPGGRPFRSEGSYLSERITRSMVEPFLLQKGFSQIDDQRMRFGLNESQLVSATDMNGNRVKLHVQLCWRRDGRNPREKSFSAAQLLAKIKDGDWEGSIQAKLSRDESHGVTHALFVQREGADIVYAAMVPIRAVLPIWIKQREVSQRLIDEGAVGSRRTKNHAANGHSPTIWLQDTRDPSAHAVADVLWSFEGVVDLVRMTSADLVRSEAGDDTFDDCPVDFEQIGTDGGRRAPIVRSYIKRDRRVRSLVLQRAKGFCERDECRESRAYPGFLDVHHILGAEKSDRFWNCVALCPNCHREAHCAPDHDTINAALLKYASEFRVVEAE